MNYKGYQKLDPILKIQDHSENKLPDDFSIILKNNKQLSFQIMTSLEFGQ